MFLPVISYKRNLCESARLMQTCSFQTQLEVTTFIHLHLEISVKKLQFITGNTLVLHLVRPMQKSIRKSKIRLPVKSLNPWKFHCETLHIRLRRANNPRCNFGSNQFNGASHQISEI